MDESGCTLGEMFWCVRCATWRSELRPDSGWCEVCVRRERLIDYEWRCAEAMELMSEEDRFTYENTEAKRAPRKAIACPPVEAVREMAREKGVPFEIEWARVEEEHCLKCVKRDMNASKKRLSRMREKTGTNPRKGKGNRHL